MLFNVVIMDVIPEKLVCFNVTKSIRDWNRASIYECVRKYWRMSLQRAKLADYCLGVSNGKVIAVYCPNSWAIVKEGEYKGRVMFEGEEITDSLFLGQDFSIVYEHVQNPVRYVGNW